MPIPSSGNISIYNTAGTCRSIRATTNTSCGSLRTLSGCAGKTPPHCMREYYNYYPVTTDTYLAWNGAECDGYGMGGYVYLKCGSNETFRSQYIDYFATSCSFNLFCLPYDVTFCVDFSCLSSYGDYSQETPLGYWSISCGGVSYSYGYTPTTETFSGSVSIYYDGTPV